MRGMKGKWEKGISGGMEVCGVWCVYTYVFCMYVNCLGQGKKVDCM